MPPHTLPVNVLSGVGALPRPPNADDESIAVSKSVQLPNATACRKFGAPPEFTASIAAFSSSSLDHFRTALRAAWRNRCR